MKALFVVLALLTLALIGCSPDESAYAIIQGTTHVDESLTIVRIDDHSRAMVSLPVEQSELHDGHFFSYHGIKSVSSGANWTILLVTPDSSEFIHFSPIVSTQSEADYTLYEGTAVSANGSALTMYNRNRSETDVSPIAIYDTPTITSYGTAVCAQHWGSGRGVGGVDRAHDEWILLPNTRYTIVIVNASNQADIFSVGIEIYRD